jgi:DNA processing protein
MSTALYQDYLSKLSTQELSSAPKELFFEGDTNLLKACMKVSVVGSRKVSNEGKLRTALITRELAIRKIVVVSGLAEGVDTIAHTEAIKFGGKTIAVLGTPLNTCTPVSNTGLLNEIKQNHLAISQFAVGSKIYPANFPMRNKTMALISDATIVIEATEDSGTKHQAWEAIRLGRQVFLLENLISNKIQWALKTLDYGAIILDKRNYPFILDQLAECCFETI